MLFWGLYSAMLNIRLSQDPVNVRFHFSIAGAPWTGMMDVYDTPLPPPMIPGANAGDTECLLDEDFRDLATSHNVSVYLENKLRANAFGNHCCSQTLS